MLQGQQCSGPFFRLPEQQHSTSQRRWAERQLNLQLRQVDGASAQLLRHLFIVLVCQTCRHTNAAAG